MVKIREAHKTDDLPAIMQGALAFAAESGFAAYLPASYTDFVEAVTTVVFMPCTTVFLAFEGDRCVGGIGILYSRFLWNHALRSADELFWWVSPDAPASIAMRLLRQAHKDAVGKADVRTFADLPSSPAKVGKLYENMGMKLAQRTYLGRVQ
jgi:hypothetical protein